MDSWLINSTQILLAKAMQSLLKAKWNQDLPIFYRRQRKHRRISYQVTASHSFEHDFLEYLRPLESDFSPISFGKAWQRLLEAKTKSWLAIFLVDFGDFVDGNGTVKIFREIAKLFEIRF